MPADADINLLKNAELETSPEQRIANWALTYGRYIMVGTEVVVLLAFISRFSLDRKRTDLKEEIEQKQAILQANTSVETTIRLAQNRLTNIKTLLSHQAEPVNLLDEVSSLLPQDVALTTFTIDKGKLTLDLIAATTGGFSQFLSNLQSVRQLSNITIERLNKNASGELTFTLSAGIKNTAK